MTLEHRSIVDSFTGEGNPNMYLCAICAINMTNDSTCADNQAGKFTHSLSTGPNLVSVPLIQFDESVETVLQTVQYDRAWSYNSATQEWKWSMKDKTYSGGLSSLNQMMGLWVNVTEDSNLTVAGTVPAQTTIHLYEGWNLVSFPSFNASYSVADLEAQIYSTQRPVPDLNIKVIPPDRLQKIAEEAGRKTGVEVNAYF